jgi:hypothetical protein
LVGKDRDEDVVTNIKEEHDLYEVKELSKYSIGTEGKDEILIDAILKVVEEVLKVSKLNCLKFFCDC